MGAKAYSASPDSSRQQPKYPSHPLRILQNTDLRGDSELHANDVAERLGKRRRKIPDFLIETRLSINRPTTLTPIYRLSQFKFDTTLSD
jgi:hypothetical protein